MICELHYDRFEVRKNDITRRHRYVRLLSMVIIACALRLFQCIKLDRLV